MVDCGLYRRVYRHNRQLFVSAGDAAIFPAAVFCIPYINQVTYYQSWK